LKANCDKDLRVLSVSKTQTGNVHQIINFAIPKVIFCNFKMNKTGPLQNCAITLNKTNSKIFVIIGLKEEESVETDRMSTQLKLNKSSLFTEVS
jgi:hypothetical protein